MVGIPRTSCPLRTHLQTLRLCDPALPLVEGQEFPRVQQESRRHMQKVETARGVDRGVAVAQLPRQAMQGFGIHKVILENSRFTLFRKLGPQAVSFRFSDPPPNDCQIEGISQFQKSQRRQRQRRVQTGKNSIRSGAGRFLQIERNNETGVCVGAHQSPRSRMNAESSEVSRRFSRSEPHNPRRIAAKSGLGTADRGMDAATGSSIATTLTFPAFHSSGTGKCNVPSASVSKIAVIVLMPDNLTTGLSHGKSKELITSVTNARQRPGVPKAQRKRQG